MFNFGGNKSDSKSTMNQDVWGPQSENLYQMYGHLNSLHEAGMPFMNLGMMSAYTADPYMQNAARYGQQQSDYMGQGGSYGDTSGMRDNLYSSLQESMNNPSSMGRMYEDIIGGPGNTYIDPMVESMKQSGMDNLSRMQSGTGLDAAQMGQGGSNRHAMQNAMQGAQASQDMLGMENMMRGTAYDKDLNWKMDIARQADLGRGQAQDRAMNVLGGGDQNRMFGMNYMPMQQNLGMGTMAPWQQAQMMPMMLGNMYSQAMGDPTVLTSGQSKGDSGGLGFGFG